MTYNVFGGTLNPTLLYYITTEGLLLNNNNVDDDNDKNKMYIPDG